MWNIEFYEKQNGRCPTQEFLDSLSAKSDLPYIMNDLERLEEFGYNLKRPLADYLRDGIYELRTRTMRGQIRLLYFFYLRDHIVITHGIKKESKVPNAEIDRAVEYKEDYLAHHQDKGSRKK